MGCRAAARSPRALTGTNCFDLECIDGQTRILYSSNGVSHDDISIPADPTQCFGPASTFNTETVSTILEQARYKADRVRSSRFFARTMECV